MHSGDTCTAQGIIYQFGNVGSALWSLTIAVHTFALLFLRLQVSDMACFMTFVGVWAMTGSIVAIGPTLVQNQQQGSFHGISGPWCWITEEYAMSRLGLEYFWVSHGTLISQCTVQFGLLIRNADVLFRILQLRPLHPGFRKYRSS